MRKYKITGMSCAACSARVERAVSALDGIDSCSVNLLTATLSVEGTAAGGEIRAAVEGAGYGLAEDVEKKTRGSEKTERTALPKSSSEIFSTS